MLKIYFLISWSLLHAGLCGAQRADTLTAVRLKAEKKTRHISVAPIQSFTKKDLEHKNSVSVADAVKYFAGISVKDYGGVGGLKTVSVRSLGANHTGVLYDGLMLGDAQGGQVDLGKYSLSGVQSITLYTANPWGMLLPARAFSTGSLLVINNQPTRIERSISEATLQLSAGSFGYFSPAIVLEKKIGRKIYVAFNSNYTESTGKYPFTPYDNKESTAFRKNSAVQALRMESNFIYSLNDSNAIAVKAGTYQSSRDLPGSIIFFGAAGKQHLKDENIFLQANWKNKFSKRSTFLFSSKLSDDKTFYIDPAYANSFGKLENNFHQWETALSAAFGYDLSKTLHASLAADHYYSSLRRTDFLATGFAKPDRNTIFVNAAAQMTRKRLEVAGNVLFTAVNESVIAGKQGRDLQEVSPSAGISFLPFKKTPLTIRLFYKHGFRPPTFNDLYYTNIGNTDLRPEITEQFNTGITYSGSTVGIFSTLSFTADGYINRVKDRILATPQQNLFQWSMQNVGEVHIAGLDIAADIQLKKISGVGISANLAYTYLHAENRSPGDRELFGTQLPYTPFNSGSFSLNTSYRNFFLSCNNIFSGSRYRAGARNADNVVNGWITTDISVGYVYSKANNRIFRIKAEANNVFDNQYEIIKFYPMPRVNYRLGLTVTFKKQNPLNNNDETTF